MFRHTTFNKPPSGISILVVLVAVGCDQGGLQEAKKQTENYDLGTVQSNTLDSKCTPDTVKFDGKNNLVQRAKKFTSGDLNKKLPLGKKTKYHKNKGLILHFKNKKHLRKGSHITSSISYCWQARNTRKRKPEKVRIQRAKFVCPCTVIF
jgi:hypothetical protein